MGKIGDFGEIICYNELLKRSQNEKKLRTIRKSLLDYEDEWASVLKNIRIISRKKILNLIRELSTLEDEGMPQ